MNRNRLKAKLQISKPTARSQAIDLIGLENVKKLEAAGLMVVDEREWVRRVIWEETDMEADMVYD